MTLTRGHAIRATFGEDVSFSGDRALPPPAPLPLLPHPICGKAFEPCAVYMLYSFPPPSHASSLVSPLGAGPQQDRARGAHRLGVPERRHDVAQGVGDGASHRGHGPLRLAAVRPFVFCYDVSLLPQA